MKAVQTSIFLLTALLLIPGVSMCQSTDHINEHTKNKEVNMSAMQGNKEVIRKVYEESLNKRSMGLLQDLISEEFEGINGTKGAAAFEVPVASVINALPDAQWKIQELFGEGDKVFVRWKLEGTHTGPFQSFTATGNAISNDGMAIFDLKDGKIIRARVHTDRLSFLQQLQVLPLDLTLLSKRRSHPDQVRFIDKFLVPAAAKKEFYERMRMNRTFIKTLPGFIEDAAYAYTDHDSNLICITVALWENMEALNKAKEAVQAEYKKQGFDVSEMLNRLNISTDRGIYTELEHH